MDLKREKLFKIIGLILIILAILGCVPASFASGGCPACGYIFVLYLYLIGIPLLLGGLTLIFWGKYTTLPIKRSKIIGIIFTTVFLIWIFSVIGHYSFERFLDHSLPKKAEKVTAQVIKSKNIEKCYKDIRVPFYFSSLHNFFLVEYFEYRILPLQAKCVTAAATAEKDDTICDSLPENGYPQDLDKAQCYIEVAVEKRDLNVCHRMYEMKRKYSRDCYWRVTKILKGLQGVADLVVDKAVKEFAIDKKDLRICIGAGIERSACEEEIKKLLEKEEE